MGFSRSEVLVYLPALGLRLALATCAWWALGCRLAGAKSALAAAHRGAPPAAAAAVRTAAFGFLAVSCVAEQLGSLAQVPAEMLHPPLPLFQAMYALPGAGALLGAPAVLVALHAAGASRRRSSRRVCVLACVREQNKPPLLGASDGCVG